MANIGDTVRFLNATGGGKITRIDGKIAYVEEDGFETPVLLKEIVVVMPAGHEGAAGNGAKLMFDQKAFDKGRETPAPTVVAPEAPVSKPATPEKPAPETDYGDRLNVVLAFEPSNLKKIGESRFDAVLVNDSNYTLLFSFSGRDAEARGLSVIFSGVVAPNELSDLGAFTHATLSEIERVAVQFTAIKRDRPFELKMPVSVTRRLDLTKFHKVHCFRPGIYFDNPVMEIPLVKNDASVEREEQRERIDLERLTERFSTAPKKDNRQKNNNVRKDPAQNPHKLLPPIEVDLHIAELTDSIAGLSNSDMLGLQLDTLRRVMKENSRRIGQKIIFIHGKGEGVLRKAVLETLRKEFPKATTQDASFREYGFGATLVTIH